MSATSETVSKIYSKRIQFHIDAATALPNTKRSQKTHTAFVSVKISDTKGNLKTSIVKGQNPTWQQNLSPMRIHENSEVVFEVKHRSIWPKPTTSCLAITDPYPLSTLLKMQGGNTFLTNIELPLHSAMGTNSVGKQVAGSLSLNVRELTSIETAKLCCELAERRSHELQGVENQKQEISAAEIQPYATSEYSPGA
ncbi:C2 domain-containing protein [Favolaschia claudopus]|uniref:C2 domain-containing protein n=1 Tax=Favolaschia claudopus TaxID=2862362 RepID=A0AAW0CXK4_9AGAR